ncbi:MAG TPA: BBP7 family outer membrane beta-barrel protein, partial [Fimbriiglobus sp.]
MGTKIQRGAVRRKLGSAVAGIFFGIGTSAAGAADPVFASPLPPGPGQVPVVSGSLVAPILMPLAAPTAAPVGVYMYGSPAETVPGNGTVSVCPAGNCDVPCPPRVNRVWVAADYFYGAGQGSWVPPLVTLSPAGTPPGQAGALGLPQTTIAFGGRREGNNFRPGFRIEAGVWCDDCRTSGFDASYFFLGRRTDEYAATQPNPVGLQLFQPAIVGTTGVGIPIGTTPAGIAAYATTDITGADLNY